MKPRLPLLSALSLSLSLSLASVDVLASLAAAVTGKIGAKTQQSRRGHGLSFTRATFVERMSLLCTIDAKMSRNVILIHSLSRRFNATQSYVNCQIPLEMRTTLVSSCMPSPLSPSRKQTDRERNKNRRPTATLHTDARMILICHYAAAGRRPPHARPQRPQRASSSLSLLPLGSSAFLSSSHK